MSGLLCTVEHKIARGCLLHRRTRRPIRQEARTSACPKQINQSHQKWLLAPKTLNSKSKVEAKGNLQVINCIIFFRAPPFCVSGVFFRTVRMISLNSTLLKQESSSAATHHKVAKQQNAKQTSVPTLSCSFT